ncbi:STAS domain-containing protein [Actinomycetospora termitidis]|uniref:STAS domain-containing protein n=1 Tax=Actinomycetospora termitidis TaxID=3053470 RepID=A0ABT7MDN2_9PSEU|nr:STAS domain-containing protein [Actinomycetospora sp. Odt1-22]MDL5158775.1 STAS domain-containing protein [Actinomycetospora sp. Odt1-22]
MVTRPSASPSTPRRGAELEAIVGESPGATVIRLRGRMRAGTARVLREAVEGVLAAGSTSLVLDLSEVVADDELGLWVVPAVAGEAHDAGVAFTVVAPHRSLRSRLRRLGGRPFDLADTWP